MNFDLEIVGPHGAGTHFLAFWVSHGLGHVDKPEDMPYDTVQYYKKILNYVENKYSRTKHRWFDIYYIHKKLKGPKATKKTFARELTTNEYMSYNPDIRTLHPFDYVFGDYHFHAHKDNKSSLGFELKLGPAGTKQIKREDKINKRLLIGLSDETKQFCTTLFFGKNRDSITKLGPNHSDKHTHVQCLDLDMRSSAGVNKKLSSLDAPNITLDYKKFFLEQDQAHIDSVAEFIGFRSTKESNEFIKQYNLRNQELYNEQK